MTCVNILKLEFYIQILEQKNQLGDAAGSEKHLQSTEKTGVPGIKTRGGVFLVKYKGYQTSEWSREHLLLRDGCRDSIREFWSRAGKQSNKKYYPDMRQAI